MKKPHTKAIKRIILFALCVALLIPGGIFLSRKIGQWKQEAEIRERIENSGIVIDLPSVSITPERIRLNTDLQQELLDIKYVAKAGICKTDMQWLINFRMNMRPMA